MVRHPFAGLKIATSALQGESDRRPADRLRGRDLVAKGGLVDALDRDNELRRLTAHVPAGLGVVAQVAVDAKTDVDPFPFGERVDHVVHDAFGRFHSGLAAADIAGHRAGEVEDELQVDGADRLLVLFGWGRRGRTRADEPKQAGARRGQDQQQQQVERALHPARRARQGTHRLTPSISCLRLRSPSGPGLEHPSMGCRDPAVTASPARYAGSRRRMERANSVGNPASRGGKPPGLVHARGIAACRRRIIEGVLRGLRWWPPRAMRA